MKKNFDKLHTSLSLDWSDCQKGWVPVGCCSQVEVHHRASPSSHNLDKMNNWYYNKHTNFSHSSYLFDRFKCSSLCVCERNDERLCVASSENLLLERFNLVKFAHRRVLFLSSAKNACHALPPTALHPLSFNLRSESPMQMPNALPNARHLLEWMIVQRKNYASYPLSSTPFSVILMVLREICLLRRKASETIERPASLHTEPFLSNTSTSKYDACDSKSLREHYE